MSRPFRRARRHRPLVVALYVGIVVANFVWLWPILNGNPITPEMWQQQLWQQMNNGFLAPAKPTDLDLRYTHLDVSLFSQSWPP